MSDQVTAFDAASHSWHPICQRTPLDDLIELEEADEDGEHHSTANDGDAGMLARCEPGILAAILRFVFPPVGNVKRFRVAQLRLICLAHHAGLEGIADVSITDLAAQLGITKAALSHWNVKIADELGQFQTRKGKSPEARLAYKISATEHHKRLGHRTPSLETQEG